MTPMRIIFSRNLLTISVKTELSFICELIVLVNALLFFFFFLYFFYLFFVFFFFFCACNRKIYDSNKYSFNRCDDVTIKTVVVEIDLANALFADYRADNQQSYKFTPSLLIFDLVTKKKKKKNILQSST